MFTSLCKYKHVEKRHSLILISPQQHLITHTIIKYILVNNNENIFTECQPKFYGKLTEAMHIASENNIPPVTTLHDPSLMSRCEFKGTVAMFLACNKQVDATLTWLHDSTLSNHNGDTVAMLLAENGVIPPKQWQHSPTLQNHNGDTVAMLLAGNGVIPPTQWQHSPTYCNKNDRTCAMCMAWCVSGKDIPSYWQHEPSLMDKDNYTVASILAGRHGEKIPQQWRHDSCLKCGYALQTIAMKFVERGQMPPKEWEHDPTIQDKYELTIAVLMIKGKLVTAENVPPQWQYHEDTHQRFTSYGSVEWWCNMYNQTVPDWIHMEVQYLTQKNDDHQTCIICLSEEECVLVKTTCGHVICQACSQKYEQQYCPYCKSWGFRVKKLW